MGLCFQLFLVLREALGVYLELSGKSTMKLILQKYLTAFSGPS